MVAPAEEVELRAGPGTWYFRRADPAPELAGAVVEYWEVEGALAPFREMVLPNGCVELMVNLGPPHRVLGGRGAGVWEGAWLSGLQERAIPVESLGGTHLVAARLHPLGAAALLGPGAAAAANGVVALAALVGATEAEALRARLLAAASPEARLAALERVLERALGDRRAADPVPDFVRRAAARLEGADRKSVV